MVYKPPLIYPPLSTHKTTLIILHGRGSTAAQFAEPFLAPHVPPISDTNAPAQSFRNHFPHTKFVFPTAPLRRAEAFNRALIHQWFDNWSLTEPEVKTDIQVPGLRETSAYLHGLLREEIGIVGKGNVVLMGLSQGCAASVVAGMLWEGEAFGGVVGMCGYVPLRRGMEDVIEEKAKDDDGLVVSGDDEEDMFDRNGDGGVEKTKLGRAVEWLREELDVSHEVSGSTVKAPMQSIPVFMGHGVEDEKVPVRFGRMAKDFLKSVNVNVEWHEYEDLGHWYSVDMLRDVMVFLKGRKGWENANVQ